MADSSGAQELVWQGAADRQPAKFLGIRVTEIRKAGSGLFGLRNSPSMPGYQPDPHIVAGTRLRGEGSLPVQARLPGGEVPAGLAPGGRAVLGLVDDEHIICILLPPASVPDTGLADWANGQTCG